MAQLTRYRGIFAPASPEERRRAFEDYWAYCEEFCHLRLFAEMFKVFALGVEWPLFSWPTRTTYAAFARCPNWLLAPIAFGSEVMGMMFYRHIWHALEEVFAAEPER